MTNRWTNESKFYADDSKLLGKNVNTNEGVRKLQADLDATSDWTTEWLMQLNKGKCVVVHMGASVTRTKHTPTANPRA